MPRIKIIAIVSALLLVAGLFLPGLAASQTEGDNWSLVSGDFGEGTRAIYSSAVYNSQLYIAIGSAYGAQVWRYDAGNHWTQVNESGFGNKDQQNIWSMVVYDSKLYVGIQPDIMTTDNISIYPACQVWCYNGATWTQANQDGFGDVYDKQVFSMAVYDSKLYAGATIFDTFSKNFYAQVWRYDGGTTWTKVNTTDGFGKVGISVPDCMAVYDSKLYVSVANFIVGASIWCYDGTTWTQVNEDRFGDPLDPLTSSARAMIVFDDGSGAGPRLYAEASTEVLGAVNKKGCKVLRYDGGKTWTQVNTDGFGTTNNKSVLSTAEFDGKLYAGTWNQVDGCEVWRYDGGTNWTQINAGGFGNPSQNTSAGSMSLYNSKLYVGAFQNVQPGGAPSATRKNNRKATAGNPCTVWRRDSATTTFYFAEGTCRPNFDSYFCIQNPGEADAQVKITYMKGDGTTAEQQLTVSKTSRATVAARDTLGTGDDAAHDFSARVECTNGQSILAERPMYFNYMGDWTGGHDVVGALSPATSFFFAEGTCRPFFDTYFCIQNPGEADAQVKITYMKGDGTTAEATTAVAKHSRKTIEARDTIGVADNNAHDFSARVESTNGQSIIAERPMYFKYRGAWTGGHDVIGALASASTFYFAEGTCRPGFDPYFCIQNPGAADAKVAITYMKGDGTTDTQDVTVGKNSRATVVVTDRLGTGDDAAHDFSAKVECTNGQAIIAERPMYFNYKGAWTGGHDVVGALAAATTFYFAEGTCRPGFDPYFCIQNPGEADAQVLITYMKGDGTTDSQSLMVGKNSRSTVYARDKLGTGDDAAHDFSATVECINGESIIAERPMYFDYQGKWTGGHDVVGFTQ